MGTVLALTVGLLLILQQWDLLHGFGKLSFTHDLLLLVLTPLLAWRCRRRLEKVGKPARQVLLLGAGLSVCLALLAIVNHAATESAISPWSTGSETRLLHSAGSIRREFKEFVRELQEPAREWPPAAMEEARPQQFHRLRKIVDARGNERARYGWTLWQGGSPVAWAGRTTALGVSYPGADRDGFRILKRGAALILLFSSQLPEDSWLLGEYLLQSPLEHDPRLPLPALQEVRREERVSMDLVLSSEEGGEDLAVFDREAGDLHWSEQRGRKASLFFPLRDPSGKILVLVTLRDSPEDAVLKTFASGTEGAGVLFTALASCLAAHLLFRSRRSAEGRSDWARLAMGSAVLWTGRAALLPLSSLFPALPALARDRFACTLAFGLFQSPADLFLTSVFLGIQVWWWDRWLEQEVLDPHALRRVGLGTIVPLALGGAFLLRLAGEVPLDARFDLLKVEFFPPGGVKLLVQAGIFLLFASWLALARGTLRSALGRGQEPASARPGRLPWLARLYGYVCLATLLYLPVVGWASARQREGFFERELLPEIEFQRSQRRDLLEGVIRQIPRSTTIRDLLGKSLANPEEGAAYRVWAATALSEAGLSSSLRIFSEDGRLLGRFGLNLPASLESPSPPPEEITPVRRFIARGVGSLRPAMLAGEAAVRTASGERVRVQVHLLDEYENLSFVRADNIYVQLFRGARPQRTNPELVGSEPLVALYDPDGHRLYSNLESGPTLPPPLIRDLAPGKARWVSLALGEEKYRALIKRKADLILAVGFLLPSALERTGGCVRLTLLGTLVALGLLGSLAFLAGPRNYSVFRGARFFRRLLVFFLVASLIPLLSLAFLFHRFAVRETEMDVASEGLASLGTARRIIEDYRAAQEGPGDAPLGDDVAFWLSRVVRQDINLYAAEHLFATSTRELYASGLLSTRLSGEVYERVVLSGDAFALSEERVADLEYLTIAAPIDLGGDLAGILSLPLALKKREILRKRADVEEAILIVTVAMLLLLTILAHQLARRVSEPIAALAEAARRIERGDYDAEVRVRARDEAALLIDSFNRMAASLRRQREDLRRRSDYIEKILLNATTGVISTDPAGRIVTINPAARLLLGLSDRPPEGEGLLELFGRSEGLGPLQGALGSSPPGREKSWQVTLPGGGERPLSLRVVSLPFRELPDSAPGRILLLEDLTETVRSSRLEAWADMARRIAHEIKNPLTPIQLSADHLRKVHRSGDPRFAEILEQCLDTIHNQVRALRRIAADFSDYARIPRLRPETVTAGEILEEVLLPYRSAPPAGIRLEARVQSGTPPLFVDRALIRRALLNLVENALEAMTAGGTLTLTAEPVPDPPGDGRPRVRIRVRDTGPGMDSETRAHLFEPYFSTKSSGTGLGLSIVRKTTEEQGGRVEIQSSPGTGTEVTLDLPGTPAC